MADETPEEMHAIWIDAVASSYPAEHAAWLHKIRGEAQAEILNTLANKVAHVLGNERFGHTSTYSVRTWLREQAREVTRG